MTNGNNNQKAIESINLCENFVKSMPLYLEPINIFSMFIYIHTSANLHILIKWFLMFESI